MVNTVDLSLTVRNESGQDQQKRAAFALAEAREIFADYHLEDIAAGVAADLALNV